MDSAVRRNKRTLVMVQLAFLVALQIILTATPLGFIYLGAMTITIVHIPVLIGATVMGPFAGGFLGLVFGISSMIKATFVGTPDAIIFSPFLTGSFKSVILAVLPRILFGIITGYLFKFLMKKNISVTKSTIISVIVGTISHTVMVLAVIQFLFATEQTLAFGEKMGSLINILLLVLATNGLIEVILAVLVCFKLVPTLIKVNKK